MANVSSENGFSVFVQICPLLSPKSLYWLPCSPTDKEKTHFLTDFYVSHFDLNLVRFVNSCKEPYLKFYNMKKAVRIKLSKIRNACHLIHYVKKYVNIQSVIEMKKQQDHIVFPKMAKMI